jgi:transcriptional regulator with GAF, ATPase, and Fis domain
MSPIDLRKLLVRNKDVSSLITSLIAALDGAVGIQDANGALLLGHDAGAAPQKHPLTLDEQLLGWVVGDEKAATVAAVVAYIANREYEKKSLAREVLDRYRELNLLYDVSEKISASLQVTTVATIAIGEARRLITSGGGVVLLLDAPAGVLTPVVALGEPHLPKAGIPCDAGIVGDVVANGRAEIVNDVHNDPRVSGPERVFASLVCAPLMAKQRAIGLFVIGSAAPVTYTAADLKFLSAIASQAAPALDHALLYERALKDAQEREYKLQQQLAALRIEVDRERRGRPAHDG